MCGLTGFARHPDAPDLDVAKLILEEGLLAMEKRGTHATGVAAEGGSNPFVWKWAVRASVAVKDTAWDKMLDKIGDDTTVVLGHTRWATQNNARDDDAAHPFIAGPVTLAHNGVIYNWRELQGRLKPQQPWIVDSQAAAHVLAKTKDPVKALNVLDGYWALTWTKGGRFYCCRTDESPLFLAYAPKARMLFWASVREDLTRILDKAGLTYECWSVKPGVIYCYDPAKFDHVGTNPMKTKVDFSARTRSKWDNRATSGVRVSGKSWDSRSDVLARGRQGELPLVGGSIVDRLDTLEALVGSLASQNITLKAEVEFLRECLEEHGLLELAPNVSTEIEADDDVRREQSDADSALAAVERESLALVASRVDEDLGESPYLAS